MTRRPLVRRLVATLCMAFLAHEARAQEHNGVVPLTLERALSIAASGSARVLEAEGRANVADGEATRAGEWMWPTLVGGATVHALNGAAMNTDGRIFSPVTQRAAWVGASLGAEWDFGAGIYAQRSARERSREEHDRAGAERTAALLDVENLYTILLAERAKAQALRALSAGADSIVGQLGLQVEIGLRRPDEVALARVQAARLRAVLASADGRAARAGAQLIRLLALPEGSRIDLRDSLAPARVLANPAAPLDTLVAEALRRRPEPSGAAAHLLAIESDRDRLTVGMLPPRLRIMASEGALGNPSLTILPVNVIDAALQWSIPLGRLFSRGAIDAASAAVAVGEISRDETRRSIRAEVAAAQASLLAAADAWRHAREASAAAAEALAMSSDRQRHGIAAAYEVYHALDAAVRAQTDDVDAFREYVDAGYAFSAACGFDLQ